MVAKRWRGFCGSVCICRSVGVLFLFLLMTALRLGSGPRYVMALMAAAWALGMRRIEHDSGV